ncbi:MAG: glycosyltransferase [Promethearchaeota archaeon]
MPYIKKKFCYFITGSNLEKINAGNSVNDYKFLKALPNNIIPVPIFIKRTPNGKVYIKSLFYFIIKLIKISLIPSNNIIIRTSWHGWLPVFFKKIMGHKIILNYGCTPYFALENLYLRENPEFYKSNNFFSELIFSIIFQFEKFLTRKADLIYVENNKTKNIVKKYGGDHKKIIIAPYYVEDSFLETKYLNYDLTSIKTPLIIGYTGRFQEYDKLEPLIKAIKILEDRGLNVYLMLIGDGPTRNKIKKLVNELNLDKKIKFLGIVSHTSISKLIDSFHILILPILKNLTPSTIPIKILEGIFKEKIIITNNTGNVKSLFSPFDNLILNNLSNPNIIAEKIIEISKNYYKYQKQAKLIKNQVIKTHNLNYYKKQVEKILDVFASN